MTMEVTNNGPEGVLKRPNMVSEEERSKKPRNNAERGIAAIKKEYIVTEPDNTVTYLDAAANDDAAEEADKNAAEDDTGGKKKKGKKARGQNKKRELAQPKDKINLCTAFIDPNSGKTCPYGEKCKRSHDVKAYLAAKQPDIQVGTCPNFDAYGFCKDGIKCRWLHCHYDEKEGKLITDNIKMAKHVHENGEPKDTELNKITHQQKLSLQKRHGYAFERSNKIVDYLDKIVKYNSEFNNLTKEQREQRAIAGEPAELEKPVELETSENKKKDVIVNEEAQQNETENGALKEEPVVVYSTKTRQDNQFHYVEAPFQPWEKKRLYYDRAKVVSPLTTVGNLPYRRLMKSLYNVDVTFSEMALSLPLLQGHNSEWALMKAHESEYPGFGAQIAAPKHWQAVKAAEVISEFAPNVSEINLNCGCPIDLLYKQGAGSGLLEQPAKTLRMLKGMSYVSKDIPVTVKIRMGTRDDSPIADSLVRKVLHSGDAAAITLHGRSRQQRYTKTADWDYIRGIGNIVKEHNEQQEENKDARDLPNGKVFFIGNGDCYNFEDWYKAVEDPGIDTVMVARGALIKPWLFEEIEAQQYLDKSATERLEIIKKYAEYAINHWGSDEYGVSLARRFLCEWLSFTYRYIPVGILERLPNQLNERPPKWKGRNELETLLGSGDYKDWIKITEMFLGPAHPNFSFIPKHKSNAY